MIIKTLKAHWILDSRAYPSIEILMSDGKYCVKASSPSGKSKSTKEANELRDNDKDFQGKHVKMALKNLEKLKPKLLNRDFGLEEFDFFIHSHLNNLGTNTTTALSIAFHKLYAKAHNIELWQLFGQKKSFPFLFSNIINGGQHGANELAIQEFMIVPQEKEESIQAMAEIYLSLKQLLLKEYGKTSLGLGDEGGFSPPLSNTREALDVLEKAINESGYDAKIALDAASNDFFNKGYYRIDGLNLTSDELVDFYIDISSSYNIISIEDPFSEYDEKGWLMLKEKYNGVIVADDLTATQANNVKKYRNHANALLTKINQAGTITHALLAVEEAKKHDWKIIVSHRSGETTETAISHIAVGINAFGLKAGAPARGERTEKYNELLRIFKNITCY